MLCRLIPCGFLPIVYPRPVRFTNRPQRLFVHSVGCIVVLSFYSPKIARQGGKNSTVTIVTIFWGAGTMTVSSRVCPSTVLIFSFFMLFSFRSFDFRLPQYRHNHMRTNPFPLFAGKTKIPAHTDCENTSKRTALVRFQMFRAYVCTGIC